MHGIVIRNTGSSYIVRMDDGTQCECKVKGNFRIKGIRTTNPVAVGDGVTVSVSTETKKAEEFAWITAIDDRRNYIIRKASNLSKQSHILAANIDLALLIVTIARPETNTTFIDRFLASAEAYRVPVVIVFNKTDDLSADERQMMDYLTIVYREVGYDVHHISALKGEGVDALRAVLAGKTTLLAGNSGVGKSTLINLLIPGAKARTSEISEAHGTGMHTTTFSQMYSTPPAPRAGGADAPDIEEPSTDEVTASPARGIEGVSLIDIPGIKGFGTFDMEPEEVGHYFREIFEIGRDCRFSNCTHTHEPGCAVLDALEGHRIAPSRYASYLSMLDDKDESKYREAH